MKKRLLIAIVLAMLATALPATASSDEDDCTKGDVQASVAEGFKNARERIFENRNLGEGSVSALLNSALWAPCLFTLNFFPPEFFAPSPIAPVFETDDWIAGVLAVSVSEPDLARSEAVARLQAFTPDVEVSDKNRVLLTDLGELDEGNGVFEESEWNDGEPVSVEATKVTFAPNLFPEVDEFGQLTGDYVDAWFKVWYVHLAPGELAPGTYQFKSCIANDGFLDGYAKALYPTASYYDPAEYPEICGFANIEIVEVR